MFPTSPDEWLARGATVILVLLSLSVHEWAHAFAAHRLGDDTARLAGRLTLNPIAHADLVGSVILPMFVPFGWAKPVPFDPRRFRPGVHVGRGSMLVAVAGPVSNFALAVLCTVLLGLALRFAPGLVGRDAPLTALLVGRLSGSSYIPGLITINVSLGIFNLLPVPPLDGGRVAEHLMPQALRPAWEGFARVAPLLLLALLVFGFGGRLIAAPADYFLGLLQSLVNVIA